MKNKIILGTAQFGMDYGISNKFGRPSSYEITNILNFAESNGIKCIDTAPIYGNSERLLGKNNLKRFDLITKTLPLTNTTSEEFFNLSYLSEGLDYSLHKLGLDRLYGLLIHRPHDLLQEESVKLYEWLCKQKELGLVEKIGISVYSKQEIDQLLKTFNFDIIQLPVNIIDQRLIHSGTLNQLYNLGVEIHCRSAFLQGLLLTDFSQLPTYFYPYKSILKNFTLMKKKLQYTALELSLGFLMSIPEISKIIVGVANLDQLSQIVKVSTTVDYKSMSNLACNDIALIDPRKWN